MRLKGKAGRWGIDAGGLLKIAILALVAVQLLSYYGAEWEISQREWSTYITASQMATNSMTFIVVRLCALALILTVFAVSTRWTKGDCICIFSLFMMAAIHMIIKVMDSSLLDSLYQSSMPLMYLLVFGFWIGQKPQLWKAVASLIPLLLCVYIVAFLVTFASFFIENGWAIFQNSSLMVYYSQAFALMLPFFYLRFQNKKVGATTYLVLIFFVIGAVVLRSRSWLIQSAALILVVSITAARIKGKSITTLLRSMVVIALLAAVAAVLLNRYLAVFWESLVEKGTTDSRSFQYTEMLEQTEWYAWIFGKGANATYISKLYGEYQFIDNEFFYLSFHYGVLFAVLYFLPFLRTFFVSLRFGKRAPLAYFAAYCALVWILSVNGLSVYHRILLDVKSFIIPAFMGYMYSDMKTREKEMNLR